MQQISNLSLQAAAWFFVGEANQVGVDKTVQIKTPFLVGRHPKSDLFLECSSVSGTHAKIVIEDEKIWLEDLKSTNGTFVNGDRVEGRCQLSRDDSIQFGSVVFQINCDSVEKSEGVNSSAAPNASKAQRLKRLFKNGVAPFFQPIIRLKDDCTEVLGYEVLGRSRLLGMRTPAQMFAAASRHEMEAELSRVLRKRGIEIADENLPEDLALFVNTHPSEIETSELTDSLAEIREQHPDRPITIEVHESVLNQPEPFRKLQTTLQNIDIQLAIYAFGSGQVSMATLSEVLPAIVKFDINLIRGIETASPKRQRFVSALIAMMKELGVVPMAEYVEQASEAETIVQLGFQLGQGFYYGHPCSITDCTDSTASKSLFKADVKNEPVKPTDPLEVSKEPEVSQDEPEVSQEQDGSAEPKNADWLMDQPGHTYTMQVLSALSEEKAREYIASQTDQDQGSFAIFSKQGKSRTLYVVVYGVFEDRSAAQVESKKFSTSCTIKPWIKLLSDVQKEIKNSN